MLWEWLLRTWSALVDFLLTPAVLIGLTSFSVASFFASVIAATWALRRLPVDYLLREPARFTSRTTLALCLRNAIGLILFVLGAIMLVLPGQGMLTIISALALMDFPGKHRIERRLMLRPRVLSAINRLRLRAGQPRLLSPGPEHP